MPDEIRETDTETFEPPLGRLDVVPDQIFIRLAPQAVSELAAVPEEPPPTLARAVREPLDYLRENYGLRSVRPISDDQTSVVSDHGEPQLAGIAGMVAATAVATEFSALAGVLVAEFEADAAKASVLREIESSPVIDFVEPVPARWLCADPDPDRNRQWGLRAIRWFESRSKHPDTTAVRVDVVDSGVDTGHSLLPPLAFEDNGTFSGRDLIGHGTHVAGIIAALTDDDLGIAGVTACALGSRKVVADAPLGNRKVDTAAMQAAINAVASADTKVLNLSLAGTRFAQVEELAIDAAIEQGVTIIAAMGNEAERGDPVCYPAAFPGVISVGAVSESGRRCRFSSTGDHIDLVAPGSNVLSTLPLQPFSPWRADTGLAAWSGTSMATPYVTAAAAMLLARDPSHTPSDIKAQLVACATEVAEMAGSTHTAEHGAGLLNLAATLS
jgi:subtilisin family serine protease